MCFMHAHIADLIILEASSASGSAQYLFARIKQASADSICQSGEDKPLKKSLKACRVICIISTILHLECTNKSSCLLPVYSRCIKVD